MVLLSWSSRTRSNLNNDINYWFDFCAEFKVRAFIPSTINLQRFISFCFSFSTIKEGSVNKKLTAIVNLWKTKGFNDERRSNPISRLQLTGYKRLRTSKRLIRKPWTITMMKKSWNFLKKNDFYSLLVKSALCIAYWHGARVG